jgi:cell division protein ZapA
VTDREDLNRGQTVRVDIYDRSYQLRSTTDERYTRRLAKSLDTTMRSIAETTHTVDSLRVAVLAALHYADRYERLKQQYDQLNGALTEKSARIQQALEAVSE